MITIKQRQRHVQVAVHALNEERKDGLITIAEQQVRLREIHELNEWPFSGSRADGGRDG